MIGFHLSKAFYLRNLPSPAGDGVRIRYVIIFRAVSDSTTIQFANWGHIGVASTELIIDDVRLIKIN